MWTPVGICLYNNYLYFYAGKILLMKAPMSDLVKKILADPKKAKAFTAAILRANHADQPVTIINEGKKYKFVRLTASSGK